MSETAYTRRRGELETYFDRTAVQAWMRLTSDAPVGRIRATVRAGRDAMVRRFSPASVRARYREALSL